MHLKVEEGQFHVKYCDHTHTIVKGHKETSGGKGYIYYLNYGGGITGVCICQNSSNYTVFIYYLNKAI